MGPNSQIMLVLYSPFANVGSATRVMRFSYLMDDFPANTNSRVLYMLLRNLIQSNASTDGLRLVLKFTSEPARGGGGEVELIAPPAPYKVSGPGAKALLPVYDNGKMLCAPISLVLLATRYAYYEYYDDIKRAIQGSKKPTVKVSGDDIKKFMTVLLNQGAESSREYALMGDRTPEYHAKLREEVNNWRVISGKPKAGNVIYRREELGEKLRDACDKPPNTATSFEDLQDYSDYLCRTRQKVCRISVFNTDTGFSLEFTTYTEEDKELGVCVEEWYYLIMTAIPDSLLYHFQPLTTMNLVINGQKFYCPTCNGTSLSRKIHECLEKCKMCKGKTDHYKAWKLVEPFIPAGSPTKWMLCNICNRSFYSNECFTKHITDDACSKAWKCLECKRSFFLTGPKAVTQEEHACTDHFCTNCKKWCPPWPHHKCYMNKVDAEEEEPENLTEEETKNWQEKKRERKKDILTSEDYKDYLFADIEATQETPIEGKEGCLHTVNLVVTQDYDGNEWPTHYTIESWIDYAIEHAEGKTIVFHNGKGYDFKFAIKALIEKGRKVFPIMVGGKILTFRASKSNRSPRKSGLRFVDSLNFLTMRLASFTSTFGLTTVKGYYPHFFNTKANTNFRGALPSLEMFGIAQMSFDAAEKLTAWHTERELTTYTPEDADYMQFLDEKKSCFQENVVWDNAYELLKYCRADVKLLREGCTAFQKIVMQETANATVKGGSSSDLPFQLGIDPFESSTLAGSALRIFRTLFLKPNLVAALPEFIVRDIKTAMAGGRTGCTKLYWKAQLGQLAHYVDFTSLYPWVNAYGSYPVGHPEISEPKTNDQEAIMAELNKYELSIMEVDVVCPFRLYHPFLHEKKNEKLMFDLMPKKNQKYTSLELKKALSLGYQITYLNKVWGWKEQTTGIFVDYIKTFLKLKQQAAGWPKDCTTSEQKARYMESYKRQEGIILDEARIAVKKNGGLYAVSKLYLNSLWGKLGQRLAEEFYTHDILFSNREGSKRWNMIQKNNNIHDFHVISENAVLVKSRKDKKLDKNRLCQSTNMALAIFTTAQARLKLYNEFLEPLGERVLYYDTDSVIYYTDAGEDPSTFVKLGTGLGEPTNEFGKDYGGSDYEYGYVGITEFISGGPKNYGYKLNLHETHPCFYKNETLKVKGFSLGRQSVGSKLNFSTAKRLLLDTANGALEIKDNEIRGLADFQIATVATTKTYRNSFSKRKILPMSGDSYMIDTLPWRLGDSEEYAKRCLELKTTKRKRDE
jgi:hypothetical protein